MLAWQPAALGRSPHLQLTQRVSTVTCLPMSHSFRTTRWSIVAATHDPAAESVRRALSQLCEQYWFPVYGFVRSKGYTAEDASDLTQSFFVEVLQRGVFQSADAQRGKLRSYLLKSIQNHLISSHRTEQSTKRQPANRIVSINLLSGEQRLLCQAYKDESPERIFDLDWAMQLLQQTMTRLQNETREKWGRVQTDLITKFLLPEPGDPTLSSIANRIEISETALKVRIHRLRRRYGEILRDEIAQTLESESSVDDELKYLFSLL